MTEDGAAMEEARAKTQMYVDHALKRDPKTKFLLKAMDKAGCSVDPSSFFRVENCEATIAGGFRPRSGVVVCQNHVQTQEEVNNLLAHELIHAYDHCRAANLDWNNCHHHTCSEVGCTQSSLRSSEPIPLPRPEH